MEAYLVLSRSEIEELEAGSELGYYEDSITSDKNEAFATARELDQKNHKGRPHRVFKLVEEPAA